MRGSGQVLHFDRSANGNAKPLRVIRGPRTGIRNPAAALIESQPTRGFFLLGMPSNLRGSPDNFVGVWSVEDEGDVPPR